MNYKTKLLLIVFSILILPPVSMLLLFHYQKNSGAVVPGVLIGSIQILTKEVQHALDSGNYSSLSKLPENTAVIIQDGSGAILYRSDGAPEPSALAQDDRDYHIFKFSSGAKKYTAILSVPGNLISSPIAKINPFSITFLLMLLIIVGLPILILHSFSASVRKLEKATVKIASGDLDFPSSEFRTTDLESLGRAMDRMRVQLREDRERRDRFIMGVSHDLKTPLAVIQGYLDALTEGLAETEEKKKSWYLLMSVRAELLGSRIAHLIDLAKTTTSEWRETLEENDLGEFMEETLVPLSEYCAIKGFTLEKRIALPSPCLLAFDRDMITRVFENLITNAVSYGEPAEPILIDIAENINSKSIEIKVQNRGQGIPSENRQKIFEPFFRGDKSRNDGGFGLGLASVKSIVGTHGWSIDVESTPGMDTTFIVSIPVPKANS